MSEAGSRPSLCKDYEAVREGGAGVIDLSSRGRIAVGGSEAARFLNGLVTNDVKTLSPNTWLPALFPNVQGRLLAATRVLNLGDHFLIDTEEATYPTVLNLLSRFTLAGDFRVTDETEHTATLSVQGERAPEIIRSVFGADAVPVQVLHWLPGNITVADFQGAPVTIIFDTHTSEKGIDLFIEVAKITDLRQALIDAGAVVVSDETFEVLRIEAGVPRYGVDVDSNTVVNETNYDHAISYTKGCYIGQEIVIRIKHRGHVAKKLTGIQLTEKFDIDDPTVYSEDGDEAGRVTSWVISPKLECTAAMAYIKYDYLKMLTPIQMKDGDRMVKGIVCSELPLVRKGFYELIDNTPLPLRGD
ncbi:MAG TPA: glycine cleavage T C-terminal barrel domain-containing protein [Pyrinomonadaceae bacterium]|jgi:aminomethyltransferase|nr:glycine cleavage T C-terminal barrel domain-containing protein [Pyrinomonadaceae bacterium]